MYLLSLLKTMPVAIPPLRILIADKQHYQCRLIEKCLNLLGQFRIAPVCSFQELDQVTQSPGLVFDLVVLNADLTREAGIDAGLFCQQNVNVRNALIYGDDYLLLRESAPTGKWGTLMMARSADLYTLMRALGDIQR
ncbi:hypothetical protein RGV33_32215 [Pseudomonas sp. Bout1]|jgi:hypothetical protein|uniref:hypothetical protein n=1 Tax=Pseudomonas sp. Bout1 TaxID=3048600 RepID=UPI002AB354D0|nr:hypothetical protein [Pseudomonas sp. Bout1]MDY7536291.1 hypothetical protein [Pseudomonas sp. Bout1]MEB0183545.1 hypothetical protein [Pseudomonas sp. Bout1]